MERLTLCNHFPLRFLSVNGETIVFDLNLYKQSGRPAANFSVNELLLVEVYEIREQN
jgi:hypothetical protein